MRCFYSSIVCVQQARIPFSMKVPSIRRHFPHALGELLEGERATVHRKTFWKAARAKQLSANQRAEQNHPDAIPGRVRRRRSPPPRLEERVVVISAMPAAATKPAWLFPEVVGGCNRARSCCDPCGDRRLACLPRAPSHRLARRYICRRAEDNSTKLGAPKNAWWRGVDSNHRTPKRADLQSAGFSHSPTPPRDRDG